MRAHDGNGLVRGSSLILEKERPRKKRRKKEAVEAVIVFPVTGLLNLWLVSAHLIITIMTTGIMIKQCRYVVSLIEGSFNTHRAKE